MKRWHLTELSGRRAAGKAWVRVGTHSIAVRSTDRFRPVGRIVRTPLTGGGVYLEYIPAGGHQEWARDILAEVAVAQGWDAWATEGGDHDG